MSSILIISPSLNAGGIERALTVLANEFVKKGLKVTFLACLPSEPHYILHPEVSLLKSSIPYKGKLGKIFFYPKLLVFIRSKANELKPDAILSFGDVFNPLVLLALSFSSHKVYISDRTSPNYKINPIAKLLKRIFYAKSTGFIAQTNRVKQHLEKTFSNKLNIEVIPNAISLVEYNEQVRKKSILYVGRLSWEKGVDRLVEAFSMLKNKDGWTLEIVGDGPQKSDLIKLVESLGISGNVIFHGLVKSPSEHYSASSIFVLPSYVEGFPNALCEAMSAELPVVCFDSIPYESIVENEINGLIVKADDIKHLAKAIQKLISDEQLRKQMGINNRIKVKEFDSEKIAIKYLNFMNLSVGEGKYDTINNTR